MSRLTHDRYYLQMLELVAARSTCGRRAVGAIIVDQGHYILSTGYNGVPRRYPHCLDTGGVHDRACVGRGDPSGDSARCFAVHAEQNALLQCSALERAWKLYTSCAPCFTCSKLIANTNIKIIVALTDYPDELGRDVLSAAGVSLTVAKP